ncbi:MOSC domain-containing protein [Kitasatospora sp. NPDC090091]|uniref:MOSC domain-containing protein n=1 Tax=Kitasatospora sp. NPDC090091 TaxID=3364081 RepID=UPI003822C205
MKDTAIPVGTVGELWRYPVKSMLGERLPAADVTDRGIDGDRRHALLDPHTGRVASAKNPRLWRRLLALTAATTADGVRITDADGTELGPEGLSAAVGRPVALVAEPPAEATLDRAEPEEVLRGGPDAEVPLHAIRLPAGTFFDHSPLHLLTTATLDRIGELSPNGPVDLRRYRPNLVVRTAGSGFVENDWIGRELAVGPQLRLRITVPTPRCAVPTLAHGPLPRDPEALRVPARHNRLEPLPGMGPHPCAGVHAQVLAPGRITEGDRVLLV